MNKDGANRLCHKYKTADVADGNEDGVLKELRAAESRALINLERQREKEEIRKRLTFHFVERRTMTFEQRKKLFTEQNRLLRFARKVMPVTAPMLWDEFKDFCEENGYDLADAVAIALGNQQDYETQPPFHSDAKKRFDLYLQEAIRACLADWIKDEEKEEYKNSQEAEPEPPQIGEETETITIERPDNIPW